MIRRPHWTAAALTGLLLAGCGSDATTNLPPNPPVIEITGVADAGSYGGPVVAMISIDHGAYQATLDNQAYRSGDTIRTPGAHTLGVSAHDGSATATRELHFTIQAASGGALIIRMFDLGADDAGGGGDAILVTDSSAIGSSNVMIDAGPAGVGASDPGFISRQLAALHVDTLAILLLTHAHSDHYGGMPAILSAERVQRFLYNGQIRSLFSYTAVIAQARVTADTVLVVDSLREYSLGFAAPAAHLTVIPPLPDYLGANTDSSTLINDGSIGARLALGSFSMLFTGDAEVAANARFLGTFGDLVRNVTVLKVGHHGANNAIFDNGFNGTSTWLNQTSPTISIISANGTTHPRVNGLNRLLAQAGNRTYCTSVHGNITIRVDRSGAYTVSAARNAAMDCEPGSEANS